MVVQVSSIDQILQYVGEFGPYQVCIIFTLCLLTIPTALQNISTFFTVDNPPWECVQNSSICTLSRQMLVPTENNYTFRCHIPRNEWKYVERDDYSVVTEFDLSCDREYLIYVATSMFFVGSIFGSVLFGWSSDRYGRVRTMTPCTVCMITISFLSSFSPTYWMFILTRLLIGFFNSGCIGLYFIIASELVGPTYRPAAGIIIWAFYTLSLILLAVTAMYVKRWKMLLIYLTAPFGILFPLLLFIPESLRWLYVNNKMEKIQKITKRIAHVNRKKNLDVYLEQQINSSIIHKSNPLLLFNSKKMAFQSFVIGFVWLANGMVYYGITLASDELTDDRHLDFILASLVEFPAAIFAIFCSIRFGRKKMVQIPLLLSGIFCVLVIAIHKDEKRRALVILRLVLGMSGKFFITFSYDVLYTWTTELYPTVIRTEGFNFAVIMSNIGAIMAPWISIWLKNYIWWLPFGTMGILAIISSILTHFLCETKGQVTAEFIEDVSSANVESERDYNEDQNSLCNGVFPEETDTLLSPNSLQT